MINWICGRCGQSWGPSVSVCGCSPPTYTSTNAVLDVPSPETCPTCTCECQDDDDELLAALEKVEVNIEIDEDHLFVLGTDLTTMRLLLQDAGYTVTKGDK